MTLFTDAILSYVHLISNIIMGMALYTQFRRFRIGFDLKDALAIQRADMIFGITALLTLGSGFWRALGSAKGSSFYFSNSIFLTKLSLFIVVGLLSIYPTLIFLKWRKDTNVGKVPQITDTQFKLARRAIAIEFHIFILMPLLAALMARGLDFSQLF